MRGFVLLAALLAWGAGGCGSDSSSGPDEGPDRSPPPSPQELRVEKIGDGEVWINWTPVAEEGVAYVVFRAAADSATVAVDTTFGTRFEDRQLTYDNEYTYFVAALDIAGNLSTPSNSVSGQPFNTLSPLAPTGLRATAHNIFILDQLDIVLDWSANGEADMAFYRVYRDTDEEFEVGPQNLLKEVELPRHVDTQIQVGTVYYYRIAAVDVGGKESAPSRRVADAALALPTLLGPIAGELASAVPVFSWEPVREARVYRVVVTSSPTSGELSDMPLTAGNTAVFVGRDEDVVLESGQIYYWKVIASTREDGLENAVSRVESFKIR
jgi:fibronectin type 3 domain-containing protein